MPFSFDWFLTIPGMLISFGIVLLVVAFIMFLVGSGDKKRKLDKTEIKVNDNLPNNEINNGIKNNIMNSIKEEENKIDDPLFIDFSELDKNISNNEINKPEIVEINNTEDEIVIEAPVKPLVVEEPEIVNIIHEEKKEETIDINSIEIKKPEEKRQIYGGADPLEATRELPKIDVHHVPYSGGKVEVPAPKVERIPDDFAFKPIVEDVRPVEIKVEQNDFKIEPMVDDTIYKFSTNVVEIPDDIEQL